MENLSIDIETFCSTNLSKAGVYKYVESEDFAILLFGYSVDGGPVSVVDIVGGEEIPSEIIDALTDEHVIKWAFNASFERICLSRFLGFPTGKYLNTKSWHCSMIWAATLGLPLSLEKVGDILNLEKQKLAIGKELIKLFCVPNKISGQAELTTRYTSSDFPEKWELFKEYNKRDVETEMSIQLKLSPFPVPDRVWEEYAIDQEINDRGVALDLKLVHNAIMIDECSNKELLSVMKELTKVDNPNSVVQLSKWFRSNGLEIASLNKKNILKALKTAPPELAEVLKLRKQLAKSSVRKYQTMEAAVCDDGRARGAFQFFGANRTGRWSGRLIQMQNLPQNHLENLEKVRELVRSGSYESIKEFSSDIPDTLSQLIRTAFIPKNGNKFIVADFSAIEARVIAWLAGEEWRQNIFADGGDIYCASASQMFGVPVEKNGINGHLRQKGKIAELALGYGGSTGALTAMGALEMGVEENELQNLVDAWRASNPNIVKLWWSVDKAALNAVRTKSTTTSYGMTFFYEKGILFITLPSGRSLAYVKPQIGRNKFGGPCITYEGINSKKKWERLDTYGPKLVENIVQAISRDILCYAMRTLRDYSIVMHVHDEIIIDASASTSLDNICELMGQTPPWAKGLLLRADGFESEFYKKD